MRLVIFSTSRRNIVLNNTTHSGSVEVGGVTITTGRSFHQALAVLGSSLTKVNSTMPARYVDAATRNAGVKPYCCIT